MLSVTCVFRGSVEEYYIWLHCSSGVVLALTAAFACRLSRFARVILNIVDLPSKQDAAKSRQYYYWPNKGRIRGLPGEFNDRYSKMRQSFLGADMRRGRTTSSPLVSSLVTSALPHSKYLSGSEMIYFIWSTFDIKKKTKIYKKKNTEWNRVVPLAL